MIVSDNAALAAVKAALNVGGDAGSAHAYEIDELKKLPSLPDEYTEVSVARRRNGEQRNDTTTGTDAFRITARQVSTKNPYNAREMRRRTRVNLEYVAIVADGATSTPVQFETAEDIEEDNRGRYSGLETYTFTF